MSLKAAARYLRSLQSLALSWILTSLRWHRGDHIAGSFLSGQKMGKDCPPHPSLH